MKQISILRGINVSGKNKILMADLKELYMNSGFSNCETYIQSGNVLFESERSTKESCEMIHQAINEKYGYDVPVQVRTVDQWISVIENYPFSEIDPIENGTKVLVTFLSDTPESRLVCDLEKMVQAPEQLVVEGSVVYLYCPNGYGKTKLNNNFIEKKLKLSATTRNWKSLIKIADLSQ